MITVWKDGWVYYALLVWGPAEHAGQAAEDLRQGITMQGHMAARLRQAIEAVTTEVPLLTPAAAEMLMGQSQAQALEPAEAFRRTYLLAGRALPTLSAAEQREMGALSTDLYARVPAGDRARLGPYLDRVRGGRETDPALDAADEQRGEDGGGQAARRAPPAPAGAVREGDRRRGGRDLRLILRRAPCAHCPVAVRRRSTF